MHVDLLSILPNSLAEKAVPVEGCIENFQKNILKRVPTLYHSLGRLSPHNMGGGDKGRFGLDVESLDLHMCIIQYFNKKYYLGISEKKITNFHS